MFVFSHGNQKFSRDKGELIIGITVVRRSEASCVSPLWLGSHTEDGSLQHHDPVQHSKLLQHLLSLI